MFYKITNNESKTYKDLVELNNKEKEIENFNKNLIEEITDGLEWDSFKGYNRQVNLGRVLHVEAFHFTEPDKVDTNKWRTLKENNEYYVPNKRTKDGKELAAKLKQQKQSSVYELFDILNLNIPNQFRFPQFFVLDDIIVLYLDERFDIHNPDVVEITKTEFEQHINDYNQKTRT